MLRLSRILNQKLDNRYGRFGKRNFEHNVNEYDRIYCYSEYWVTGIKIFIGHKMHCKFYQICMHFVVNFSRVWTPLTVAPRSIIVLNVQKFSF